jgi:hypothetical protein
MPNIITASQLRSVLGVSSSLYDDAYLNDIIDTAEQVILPLLIQNSTAVVEYKLETNVATFFTRRTHPFVVGQSIVVTGLPAPFTATHTLTVVTDSSFSAALTIFRRYSSPDYSERHGNTKRLFSFDSLRRKRVDRVSHLRRIYRSLPVSHSCGRSDRRSGFPEFAVSHGPQSPESCNRPLR